MRKGHTSRNCKIIKFDVSNGELEWKPRCVIEKHNIVGPKLINVPYSSAKSFFIGALEGQNITLIFE